MACRKHLSPLARASIIQTSSMWPDRRSIRSRNTLMRCPCPRSSRSLRRRQSERRRSRSLLLRRQSVKLQRRLASSFQRSQRLTSSLIRLQILFLLPNLFQFPGLWIWLKAGSRQTLSTKKWRLVQLQQRGMENVQTFSRR